MWHHAILIPYDNTSKEVTMESKEITLRKMQVSKEEKIHLYYERIKSL